MTIRMDVLGIIAPHPPIMVPEVGGAESGATATSSDALGAARIVLERFAPDAVVLMSPHAPGYRDAFGVTTAATLSGDLAAFRAPQVTFRLSGDPELAVAILAGASGAGITLVPREDDRFGLERQLDHGVIVPISFLDPEARYPLVVLSLCYLSYEAHRRLGSVVRDAAASLGRRVAFVASGDCSHRLTPGAPAGYSPDAHLFDARLVELLSANDFAGLELIDPALVEEAGECGLRSFIALGGFLEGSGAASRVLAYEDPWGVGYLTAVFGPEETLQAALGADGGPVRPSLTPRSGSKGGSKGSTESEIVRLARETIECYVRDGSVPDAPGLADPALPARAGAFVSIHEEGALRGCIGTIGPTQRTLAEEVVHNAIEAATRDPRLTRVADRTGRTRHQGRRAPRRRALRDGGPRPVDVRRHREFRVAARVAPAGPRGRRYRRATTRYRAAQGRHRSG
jgi:aromatic ring-opening dioxygenase LigB subunit